MFCFAFLVKFLLPIGLQFTVLVAVAAQRPVENAKKAMQNITPDDMPHSVFYYTRVLAEEA